jgi:transposase
MVLSDSMSRIVVCPKCKFRFDIGYGRTFACIVCSLSSFGSCGLVKCPKCGNEFPE